MDLYQSTIGARKAKVSMNDKKSWAAMRVACMVLALLAGGTNLAASCLPDASAFDGGYQCIYVFDGCLPIPLHFVEREFSTGEKYFESVESQKGSDPFRSKNKIEFGERGELKIDSDYEIEYLYDDFTFRLTRTRMSTGSMFISMLLFDDDEYVLIGTYELDPWLHTIDGFVSCKILSED